MLPRLEDDYRATVQARGLTPDLQFQQANSFILKILERDVLLPYPEDKNPPQHSHFMVPL